MFNDFNFFIFILLLLFSVLLLVFGAFVDQPRSAAIVAWILLTVPVIGFMYLMRFPSATVTPFYILFTALLLAYVALFGGIRIYDLFN